MIVGRSFKLTSAIKRILLIQLGDIGDVVWSLPTIRAIKEAYPESFLSVCVREGHGGDLLRADPHVDQVREVARRSKSFFKDLCADVALIKELKSARFDAVFDLRGDERGAFLAFFTRAPLRAAQYYENVSLLRNVMFTHLVRIADDGERRGRAAEQSLRIVRCFGIDTEHRIPKIYVREDWLHNAKAILGSYLDMREGRIPSFISVSPFSRWFYKEWPIEKWQELLKWVVHKIGVPVVVVGSENERKRVEDIVEPIADGIVLNLAGKTTLSTLAALLSMSSLHIGVDTAGPHIAAAVGTPTVTLYGPTDWREWAPIGEKHFVVSTDLSCAPCYKKGCGDRGRSLCMEELPVDKVKEVIRRFFLPLR
ncbi:MAG: glycosyltransferase family 9 protein [Syntrophales bacterium]|nr:glycosyltransferase family 9 protein [Syntrophales bacterium]